MKRRLLGMALICGCAWGSSPAAWEMSSFADFIKGKFEGVSLGRDGKLSAAPKLDMFFESGQPVIWSLASAPDGSFYAATGHRGRVFHVDANGAAKLVWTADRPEVFAITVDKAGVLYAASSPDGKIYRIVNGVASEYFDPKTKYIWSLAIGSDGVLYAGTGDGGRVFRITGAGKGEVYYSTGQGNVTSLLMDPHGQLLAGTEPNGILYRITAKDKAFALYDSSLPEIRAIGADASGAIYAAGLGGALAKKLQAAQQGAQGQQDATPTISTTVTVTADTSGDLKPTPPEPAKPQASAPAQTTPAVTTSSTTAVDLSSVEKSAIYRINPDNTVDTLWSSKEENVYDILPGPGELHFGTDQSGRVYRLTDDHKLTLVAQTNESDAVRLMRVKGAILVATANMGKVYRLGSTGAQGTYESPVFDASGVAKWGKFRSQSQGVTVRTRAGNSIRPDGTWSDWAALSSAQIASPNARYLQFKADFSGASAALENVNAAYLPQNNPPSIRSITVLSQALGATPASTKAAASASSSSGANAAFSVTVTDTGDPSPVASTGTPTQTLSRAASQQLTVTWQADDPDGDRLVYDLSFKGEGENDWKTLKKGSRENTFPIDGDALADGRYLFRVVASDREANSAGSAKDAELISSPVLIDNTAPVLRVTSSSRTEISFEAADAVSALKRAEWSMDAGPWMPVDPIDGILDSPSEQFRLRLAGIPAGEHLVVIRVSDSGNNTSLAKVILR